LPLPPVVQEFGIQAASFLAGIDEMLAATDRLAGSLDAAAATAERLSGVFDATAAADERFAAAEEAAEARAVYLADAMDRVVTGLDESAAASDRAMAAADELAAAYDRAGESAVVAGDRATVAGDKAAGAGDKAAGFGSAMKTAFLGVGIALVYGIAKAAEYQTATTRLVTSAGESARNIAMVRQGMLTMAGQVGIAAIGLAKGMYTVESAGYHGAAGLIVLKAAAQGAKDEGADLATVANAVTDALTDYHLKASDAANVTSQLVTAVGFGKTTFQDFSGAMSIVLPLASSLHLKLADVTGVMAEMTSHGISANEAGQQIANTMRHLAVPTATMQKEFGLLGISSTEINTKMGTVGLGGTLQWLDGVARKGASGIGQTYNQALSKTLGSASGLQVALTTTGKNADATNKAIKGIGKASADAHGDVKGFADVQKTMGQQWAELVAGAQSLAIAFGTVLLPMATKVVGALAKFGAFLEKHPALAAFAGAILAVAAAFKIAATVAGIFDAVLDANPVMLIILAIIALVAGLYLLYRHFKIVRDVVADVGKFFKAAWTDAMKGADAIIKWFVNGPLALIKQEIGVFSKWWSQNSAEIMQVWKGLWGYISAVAVMYWKVTWAVIKLGLDILKIEWKITWTILKDTLLLTWNVIKATVAAAIKVVLDIIAIVLDLITGHWSKAWSDIKKLVGDYLHGVASIIGAFGSGAIKLLYDAGKAVVQGLINGIKDMFGSVGSVAGDLFHGLKGAFTSVAHIFSPSRVFYALGGNITTGLALGITETAAQVYAAARTLAQKVISAFGSGQITGSEESSLLSRITSGLSARNLSLAKITASINAAKLGADITARLGAGMTETLPQARAAARNLMQAIARELSRGEISTAQAEQLTLKIQAALTSRQDKLVKTMQAIGLKMAAGLLTSLEGAATASQAKSAVNKMITDVQQAWAAGDITTRRASYMTKWLEADSTRLQALAARRQTLLATIKAADAYAATTATNTEQWAGLTSVAGNTTSGGMVYSGNLLAGMQANLAKIRQFGAAIKRLAKLGLRKDLIDQIVQMGPDQGLQVANALIDGPAKVIAEMDATQKQIVSGSNALGQAAANAMYDNGKQAGKGFLSGLQAQEHAVTAMMDRAAVSMVKTMRRELGMGGHGGGAMMGNVTVNVPAGFVGTRTELAREIKDELRSLILQYDRKNGKNGLSLNF
jgi:TP901 family phage tail tape measure protein